MLCNLVMVSPMTLQQLNYSIATIEHGTFSEAAESLHISQPSLSEQILRLEEHLGTHVFSAPTAG